MKFLVEVDSATYIHTHTTQPTTVFRAEERENRGIGREKRKASGGAQRARVS